MGQTNFDGVKWEEAGMDERFIHLEVEESVIGTYVGKEESDKFKGTFNFKIDVNGMGDIKLISGTVISTKFKDIPIGSAVKIKYLGKPKGKNYDNYQVQFGKLGA